MTDEEFNEAIRNEDLTYRQLADMVRQVRARDAKIVENIRRMLETVEAGDGLNFVDLFEELESVAEELDPQGGES